MADDWTSFRTLAQRILTRGIRRRALQKLFQFRRFHGHLLQISAMRFQIRPDGARHRGYRDAGDCLRDPDVQANLQFARNQIPGENSVRATFVQRWLGRMTANEWTLLTAAAVWLWFALLAAVQWKPAWKRSLRSYTTASTRAGLLAVCTGAPCATIS